MVNYKKKKVILITILVVTFLRLATAEPLENRPTYEVKIFLLMNLGYELIKYILKEIAVLTFKYIYAHFDGQI